jgi:hypothetical protein
VRLRKTTKRKGRRKRCDKIGGEDSGGSRELERKGFERRK